jgi:hypothetical protein
MKLEVRHNLEALKPPKDAHVKVGVLNGDQKPYQGQDVTLGVLSHILHDGTGTAPARPFLRAALARPEMAATLTKIATQVAQGKMTQARGLALLGEYARGLVIRRIVERDYAPNAPSTIAAKGSDTPLVDEGILKGSITYKVEQ